MQNKGNDTPKDRPGATSQHVAIGRTTSRKRPRVVISSDDEDERYFNQVKNKAAPAAKKHDSGPKIHRNFGETYSQRDGARRSNGRTCSAADLFADEGEDEENVYRRLSAEAKTHNHGKEGCEMELSRQAAARKEAFARSCSLAGLAAFLEKEDTGFHDARQIAALEQAPARRGSLAALAAQFEDEKNASDARTAAATKILSSQYRSLAQLNTLTEEEERVFHVARQTSARKPVSTGNSSLAQLAVPLGEAGTSLFGHDIDVAISGHEQNQMKNLFGMHVGGLTRTNTRPKAIGKPAGWLPKEIAYGHWSGNHVGKLAPTTAPMKTLPSPNTFPRSKALGRPVGWLSGQVARANGPETRPIMPPQPATAKETIRSKGALIVDSAGGGKHYRSEEAFRGKSAFANENESGGEYCRPKKVVGGKEVFTIEYDSDGAHYCEVSDVDARVAAQEQGDGEEMIGVKLSDSDSIAAAPEHDNCDEMIGAKVGDIESKVAAPEQDNGVEMVSEHVTMLREKATHKETVPCKRGLVEPFARNKGENPLEPVDKHIAALTNKNTISRATAPPTIMPIVLKSDNIMSALDKPKPSPGKSTLVNGYPAEWFKPTAIRWQPGALEYLKKKSNESEVAADKAFAAEIVRVRAEGEFVKDLVFRV